MESDSCDHSGVGLQYFHEKKDPKNFHIFEVCSEGKIPLTLFGDHIFSIWQLKKISVAS